jgi:microcompartment protein CcmK/EutM
MQLARVIGTVVATVKNDSLAGRKLLVVQTLDRNLESTGKPMVAVDAVGAGVGELVFWCRGKEASFPFKREDTPTVATQKNRRYDNARVMLCQQITPEGEETSYSTLALDSVDAGVGDTVLIVQEGWSASTAATGEAGAAIDSAIVGVVDRIDLL